MKSSERERRLNDLFEAYRMACPDMDAGVNFTPNLWAKIEACKVTTQWFRRGAMLLVTAGLAASAILSIASSLANHRTPGSRAVLNFDATFVQALTEDRASAIEPLNLDRLSELEQP